MAVGEIYSVCAFAKGLRRYDGAMNSRRVSFSGSDLHEDKQQSNSMNKADPPESCCSTLASLSSPRRSVAFYDFESVLQPVIFACQRSVEATLLCSCFISRINDTACALAGPS